MRSPAAAAKLQGMAESADASGAVSRFAIEQTLQQTVQIRQVALPVASIVAGQLAQSLKFERAAALHAQAPAAELKDSEEGPASGAAGPQALVGVVVHEELDLTHLMSAHGVQAGADTTPAVSSPGNAGEAKASEGVWRQERVQQDLQYQKLSEQMMEAVGRRITDQVTKGVWQMSFQLRPARLGTVDVSLGMANGTIDAAFSSAQAETRQLLDSGLTRLKEVLQGAGFEVGNLQTGGRGAGEQSGRRSQSGSREMGMPPASGMAPATRGVELNASGPRTLLSADGVDLIV
jgi:flagellar hook-length control protein FliK